MAEILATERDGGFEVTLTDGASVSQHAVSVRPSDLAELGLEGQDPRLVVEESFRFLLERYPKESIMGSFDLATITRFFPEYPEDIRRWMSGDLDLLSRSASRLRPARGPAATRISRCAALRR